MKKIIIAFFVALGLGYTLLLSSCSKRYLVRVFFGVKHGPVALSVKDAYTPRTPDAKAKAIVKAANTFLTSLTTTQKKALSYVFSDNKQRANWSNFPEGMIARGGLKLGSLSKEQRTLLDKLLAEVMSPKGMQNIKQQLAAEDALPPSAINKYGTQYFYVAFLGTPSETLPWMFQFGGHHLGLNVTLYGAEATFSPMLTGAQPAHLQYKGEEIFITQEEFSAAQAFMDSLTEKQRKLAVRSDKVIKLQFGPGEYGKTLPPEGIKGSELTGEQKRRLLSLINSRMEFINEAAYAALKPTILNELDDTYFGWWGSQENLRFYFRVTAPSLILEYAPQEDENQITHLHSMYRNPKNDYGAAWLSGKE